MSAQDRRDLVLLLHDLRELEPRHCLTFLAEAGQIAWQLHLPDSAPGLLRQRLHAHRPEITRLLADVLTERCLEHEAPPPLWERVLTRAMLERDLAEAPQFAPARALLSQSHGIYDGDRMLATVLLAFRAGQKAP